jgi:hypothetical protein
VTRPCSRRALRLAWLVSLGCLGCTPRPATTAPGIELEDPNEPSPSAPDAGSMRAPRLSGSSEAESSRADPSSDPSNPEDADFVHSREPLLAERIRAAAALPIHIQETWWPFRARHLNITEGEAQKRDTRISDTRAPSEFWDPQTAVEAVSLWTVLCNECHGGRRSIDDALEMAAPAGAWGEDAGLFFGNRRPYRQVFRTVHDGGPKKPNGRVGMPAWRNILSNEMIWSLLYFLEYQSGDIESRSPPSLYPRQPKGISESTTEN